jgi:hypothetical protein
MIPQHVCTKIKKQTKTQVNNADLIDLFVHLPLLENEPFILDYQLIAQAQLGDAQLQQLCNSTPAKFQQQLLAPRTFLLILMNVGRSIFLMLC